jgi:hypothetical protein
VNGRARDARGELRDARVGQALQRTRKRGKKKLLTLSKRAKARLESIKTRQKSQDRVKSHKTIESQDHGQGHAGARGAGWT